MLRRRELQEKKMSLLGFDAPGRLALGQLPTIGAANTVLTAGPGSYAVSGPTVAFRTMQPSSTASAAVTGSAAVLSARLAASVGSHSTAGGAATFSVHIPVPVASFVVDCQWAISRISLSSFASTYVATGIGTPLGIAISSGSGSYAVAGYEAGSLRDFEAWFPRPFDSNDWIAVSVSGDAWTRRAVPSEIWTARAKQPEAWAPSSVQARSWTPAEE